MSIQRRGFLAGLLALPFIAPLARAAQAVKRKLWPAIYVGQGQSHATIASALRDIEPGGTIYLIPGHRETITATVDDDWFRAGATVVIPRPGEDP